MTNAMTLIDKYKKFLDEIGWDEFNDVEKQYFFDDINREPDGDGTLLQILPNAAKKDYIDIKHLNTGSELTISQKDLKAFRRWLEENFAHGEDGSSYFAWKEAINKEESQKNVYEYDLEQKVLSILQDFYSPRRILRGVAVAKKNGLYIADFVIIGADRSVKLIVEAKAKRYITRNVFLKYSQDILSTNPEAVFALTDGESAIYSAQDGKYKVDTLKKLLDSTLIEKKQEKPTLTILKQYLKSAITDAKRTSTADTNRVKRLYHYINNLRFSDFLSDAKDSSIWYLKTEKERELFRILLGEYIGDYIVKFSSYRSLQILLEKETIGMCSLVCMNDPSEKDYADTSIGFQEEVTDNSSDTFIISACDENAETNLTMWRLYGDDAKGVCLKFHIDKDKLNQNGFYLAPVSYSKSKKDHFELNVIKNILIQPKTRKWKIELSEWDVWKHFFKQHTYAIEKEIRLVYMPSEYIPIAKSVWFPDDRTSIYSEMKTFDLSHDTAFPLTLSRVILGTKFPNPDINVKQFKKRLGMAKIITDTKIDDLVTYQKFDYV